LSGEDAFEHVIGDGFRAHMNGHNDIQLLWSVISFYTFLRKNP
jgi:hypothetical protein